MEQLSQKKAPPPPPAFIKKPTPPPPPPARQVKISIPNNTSEDVYIPTNRPENIKNEQAAASSFSKQTEDDLFETFGEEVMSLFITNSDRIGAAYVIMQSTINAYITKNKLPDISHSLLPSDLDGGIDGSTIRKIVIDLNTYYEYFSKNSNKFAENTNNFNLQNINEIDLSDPENIIIFTIALFKTISSLDVNKDDNQKNISIHAPYESDMIDIDKKHKDKMWELAKQVKDSIYERDAIINEIAIPIIKKGYPVDAKKLAANFLKESKLNPETAIKALYTNPATFAPILVDKLPRKFFGLMKPGSKDAIELNKSLGRFLKKYVS